MDDVWGFLPKVEDNPPSSVHLAALPKARAEWLDDELDERWERLLRVKGEIAKALEAARRNKVIGHPLDARVTVFPPDGMGPMLNKAATNLKDILIVSQLVVASAAQQAIGVLQQGEGGESFESDDIPGLKVAVEKARGEKCERCWNYSESVGTNSGHPTLCERCWNILG
jgi:isoleucyl-tRNA synthetase